MTGRSQPATSFERGVAELSPGLRAFLRRRLGSDADAEDALQDILTGLFRTAGPDLSGIVSLPAWLYRAARNLLANLARSPWNRAAADEELLLSCLVDEAESQEMALLRNMFWAELYTALSELPAEQRRVWEATELEGVPVGEIARLTGTPQATLLSRKHYAVLHLRKRLHGLYQEIINR